MLNKIVLPALLLCLPWAAAAQTDVRVNAGGSAVAATGTTPAWMADRYFSGTSGTSSTTNAIDVTGVTNPAPQAVYRTSRYTASTSGLRYTIPGLVPGKKYAVNLHCSENSFSAAGARQFNVRINGLQVLTNFDIFAAAGRRNKAVVRTFHATSSAAGTIEVLLTLGSTGNPSINGIELVPVPAPTSTRVTSVEVWTKRALTTPQQLANAPALLGDAPIYAERDLFEGPVNIYGNFVSRQITKFLAPMSGTYRFWIAADQKAMLWISPDAPNFVNRAPICKVMTAPPPLRRQWGKYAEQASAPLSLEGGRTYYLMAIQTEADGNNINHLSVGWMLPGGTYERPIPGSRLILTPPMAMSMSASPASIRAGAGSVLAWGVSNATGCSASAVPAQAAWTGPKSHTGGRQTVTPAQTTAYTLICTGVNGVGRTVQTTVAVVPPLSMLFTAAPTTVVAGAPTTLTWSVSNAASCSASASPAVAQWSGGKSATGGTQVVTPSVSTAFTLTCVPSDGSPSASSSVTVTVVPDNGAVIRNPRRVEFLPSADHNARLPDGTPVVANYSFEIYMTGATAPFHTINLGKPAPGTDGIIRYDFSSTVPAWPLPGGIYEARVAAVGPNGSGRSSVSNRFDFNLSVY